METNDELFRYLNLLFVSIEGRIKIKIIHGGCYEKFKLIEDKSVRYI